jgi:hypothetical protein
VRSTLAVCDGLPHYTSPANRSAIFRPDIYQMNAEPAQLVFSFSPGIPSEIVWAEREHWWYRASG